MDTLHNNNDLDYLLEEEGKPYLAQIAALESGDKPYSKPARSNTNSTTKKFFEDNLQSGAIDGGGQAADLARTEGMILRAAGKRDNASRRSKESRKSAGRHMSRHVVANSDLLDLGLQVGEQVNEEEDEGASARLSKR